MVAWSVLGTFQPARVIAAEAAPATVPACAAATPAPNPWTRRLPAGWWMKRHEEILSSPLRKEARIAFIGVSITDGWDDEQGGLKVWEKKFAPLTR